MPRGGSRTGAGRKGLSGYDKLVVGAECDRRWHELAEREAMERYEALPTTKDIRLEQSRADLIPENLRRAARGTISEIRDDIDDITGGARLTSIEIKRPYGAKEKIISEVVAWAKQERNEHLSASQVAESWKHWNKFKKSPEYKARLKST